MKKLKNSWINLKKYFIVTCRGSPPRAPELVHNGSHNNNNGGSRYSNQPTYDIPISRFPGQWRHCQVTMMKNGRRILLMIFKDMYTLHQVEQPHPLLNLNLEFKKKYWTLFTWKINWEFKKKYWTLFTWKINWEFKKKYWTPFTWTINFEFKKNYWTPFT